MKPVTPPSSSSRKTTVLRAEPGVGSRESESDSFPAPRRGARQRPMVIWLVSPTPDPRRATPARQACCPVFRPKNAFLWRAVTFFQGKRVYPMCCRACSPKNVFFRRAIAFFLRKTRSSGVLSRFSAEKRVHPRSFRATRLACRVLEKRRVALRIRRSPRSFGQTSSGRAAFISLLHHLLRARTGGAPA